MRDDLGYALVGDIGRFDIKRIYLHKGLLWIDAASSAVPKFNGGKCMVRIYSPDGKVVGIIRDSPIPGWHLGPNPGTATISFSVKFESSAPGEPYMEIKNRRRFPRL